MLTVLDLFSGIGGFSLGLERTGGFKTIAFCEIDPFCRKVLKKHWPEVPIFEDVRTLRHEQVGTVDVICGGFPCQDISVAGKGAGIEGERSGLWKEYARIIGEVRPRYVLVENVAALLGRGLGRVLGDLAEIGYDCEWHCIPASAVGAPHRRDRVWIVAYRDGYSQSTLSVNAGQVCKTYISNPMCEGGRVQQIRSSKRKDKTIIINDGTQKHVADSKSTERQWQRPQQNGEPNRFADGSKDVSNTTSIRSSGQGESLQRSSQKEKGERKTNIPITIRIGNQWSVEPNVGRVANGVPSRVDRLKGLGNAVVPEIPEIIGRAILKSMEVT